MVVKKDNKLLLVYGLFFCFLFVIHALMEYVGDDAIVSTTIDQSSLAELFVNRFYENGRIFTDVLANAFYRMPMIIWKLFDTLVYLLILRLLVFLFGENTVEDTLIIGLLMMLYPFSYLSSAGYIATSTNYIYPILCLLLIMVPFRQRMLGYEISMKQHVVSVIAILYVSNHDQSAMVLVGGLLLALLLNKTLKLEKKNVRIIQFYLLLALVAYGVMFFMPGHLKRMQNTTEVGLWFPQYVDWSFGKKLYHGYSSTVANLLYGNVKLFQLFCLLLLSVALIKKAGWKIFVPMIPIAVMVFSEQIGDFYFVGYYPHTSGMPELVPLDGRLLHYIPLVFSIIAVIGVFASIWLLVYGEKRRWTLLCLLLLGAGSRGMMGLSPTIYESSYRTFSIFLYVLIISNVLLLREIKEEVQKRDVEGHLKK